MGNKIKYIPRLEQFPNIFIKFTFFNENGIKSKSTLKGTGKYHAVLGDPQARYLNDEALWQCFIAGDEEAFISIYNKYFDILIDYGYQLTFDIKFTEDLVQDLFLELRKKRTNLSSIRSSIKVYLMVSLKNRFLNSKRNKSFKLIPINNCSPDSFKAIDSVEQEIIDRITDEETIKKLKNSINQLPYKQREAIFYYFYEGMAFEDIRVLLDMGSINSTRNLIHKAIKALKVHFVMSIIIFLSIWGL
jgi:RNA polymerase sigma factor (sigma-70 family)